MWLTLLCEIPLVTATAPGGECGNEPVRGSWHMALIERGGAGGGAFLEGCHRTLTTPQGKEQKDGQKLEESEL